MRRCRFGCAWGLVLAACGHDAPPPSPLAADLGGDVVARAGGDAISASLVAEVARAKDVPPRVALGELVDDALAAEGARAAGYEDDPAVRWPIISARARAVAAHIRDGASAAGPVTDAEIDELTQLHWRRYDVPEGMHVVHAVAMFPKKRTPETDAAVKATFDRLTAAVAHAPSRDDFEAAAKAVHTESKVEIRVEELSLTVDGRSLDQNGAIEQPFATAAASLGAPAEQARAQTLYGYHVIQLIERLPAKRLPLAERRLALEGEALATRALRAYEGTLAELRGRYPVEVNTAADALMRTVSLTRP